MRQFFTDIAGNRRLRERLGNEIGSGKLSHAYLIEGRAGTGKHTVALRVAASLACEHRNDPSSPLPCLVCPACKKILSGNSPDVIFIGRGEKATLGVEEIRNLKSDVFIAPNDNETKVYIIEDAHTMTVQAQNALLLTLEEPPPYVLFLLLCETSAAILETIRSRAQTLRTEPLSREELRSYLLGHSPDAERLAEEAPGEFSEILAIADGSVGQATALLDPKSRKPILEKRAAAREFIRLASARRDSAAVLRFLSSLGQKRDEIITQFGETLLCLRDLLLCKQADDVPLCFFADAEEAHTLAYGFTTPELLRYCECIDTAVDRLRANANVRLALTSFAVGCGLLSLS